MTSLEEAQALKKRPTNIVHAETEPGPWSLKKGVKFGYTEIDDPTSAPNLAETAPCEESQNLGHILDIFCSSCQFDSMFLIMGLHEIAILLRNLHQDASPRPAQHIRVLDDPIVRGKRFTVQCKAPKESLGSSKLVDAVEVYLGKWHHPFGTVFFLYMGCCFRKLKLVGIASFLMPVISER